MLALLRGQINPLKQQAILETFMRKNFVHIALTAVILAIVPAINEAQEMWDYNGGSVSDIADYSPYYDQSSYYDYYRFNDPMNGYSTPDYYYNSPYYAGHMTGAYRGSGGYIHFGRSFDNSDNFSSGISSYQGTSTGPGPNGGYPGAPRGVYPTNYVDNSIYPNSYMRFQSK
jgi:hypothetical protein